MKGKDVTISFLFVVLLVVFGGMGSSSAQDISVEGERPEILAWQPIENGLLAVTQGTLSDYQEPTPLRIYDAQFNQIQVITIPERQTPRNLVWSPDGSRLALGTDTDDGSSQVERFTIFELTQENTLVELNTIDMVSRAGRFNISWHPDNRRIALVMDTLAEVWDVENGNRLARIITPRGIEAEGIIRDTKFSPDGQQLVAATDDFFIHVIDANTYEVVQSIQSDLFQFSGIAWKPDSSQFAVDGGDRIVVFSAGTYQEVVRLDPDSITTRNLVWQGDFLAAVAGLKIVTWNTNTWELVDSIPLTEESAVLSLSWKPGTQTLAYLAGTEGQLVFQDISEGTFASVRGLVWQDLNADGLQTGEESNGIADVTVNLYDATDTQVATTTTAADGTYRFDVEPDTPYTIEVIPPDGFTFTTPDVGEDDTLDSDIDPATGCTPPITIAVGQSDDTWDGGLLSGDDRQATFQLSPRVAEIAWSPQGDRIAVIVRDGAQGTVIVYDAATFEEIGNITGLVITSIDWKSDGTQLAVLKSNGPAIINVWDVTTDPFTLISEYQDSRIWANMLSWRPGSNEISINSPDAVRSIDAQTGTVTREFIYSRNYTTGSLKWSPDGSRLLTDAGRAFIWDGDSGLLMIEISTGSGVFDWSPDGDSFVVDQVNNIQILDAQTGNVLLTLDINFEVGGELRWRGSIIAGGRDSLGDFGIYLWDANTGQILRRVEPLDIPEAVALSPDGTRLAYGTEIEAGDTLHIVNTTEVSGLIWQDTNADGLRTGEESNGIADVTVNLYDATDTQVATTTTASDGTYSFEVEPDTPYTIEVIPPDGFTFSPQDVGADDTIDSDVNVSTGRIEGVTLAVGDNLTDLDGGLVPTSGTLITNIVASDGIVPSI